MSNLSFSLFDPAWQRYCQDGDPNEFLQNMRQKEGVVRFAEWATAKILKEKATLYANTTILEKLASDIKPIDPEASAAITKISISILSQQKRKEPPADLVEGRSKREKVEPRAIWERHRDPSIPTKDLLSESAYTREGFAPFANWINANVFSDQDLAILERRADELRLLNCLPASQQLAYIALIKRLIPPNQRVDAQPYLDLMFRSGKGGEPDILKKFKEIPPDIRAEVLKHALPFCEDITLGIDRGMIISEVGAAFGKIPPDQREDAFKYAISYCKNIVFYLRSAAIHDFFNIISKIQPNLWADVCKYAKPFCDGTDSYNLSGTIKAFAEAFSKIQPDQREEVCKYATPFLKGFISWSDAHKILLAFSKIAPNLRDDVSKYAKPFCEGVPDSSKGFIIGAFGSAFREILPNQREEVCKIATPFLRGLNFWSAADDILLAFSRIPSNLWADVSKYTAFFCKGFVNDSYDVADALKTIGKIPPGRWEDVMEKAMAACRQIDNNRHLVLKAFSNIPQNDLADVTKRARRVRSDEGISDGIHLAWILRALSEIPHGQRKELLVQCNFLKDVSFFEQLDDEDCDNLHHFIDRALPLIPPELRYPILLALQQDNDLRFGSILSNLMQADPDLRTKVHDYIQQTLDKVMSNESEAFALATRVLDNADSLGLHEAHPLFERAIITGAIADPDARKNRKNPYRVFVELKETLQKEEPIQIELEPVMMVRQSVRLDLNGFRKRAAKLQFTFKDLPAGIEPDTFKKLFKNLEERFHALSEKEQEEFEKQVKLINGSSLQQSRANLEEPPLINRLMSIKGDPDEAVETAAYQLHTIVKALNDKSNVRKPGALFSEQEEFLLRIAGLIAACASGQRDGIGEVFHKLPVEYRIKGLEKESVKEERAKRLVDQAIQDVLNKVVANPEFLQEVAGIEQVPQQAHQTQYIINRYHKQSGLQATLTFDEHSGVLLDQILDAPPEKVLKAIFRRAGPEFLENVKRNATAALNAGQTWFLDLSDLLEGSAYVEGWQQKYMQFDEETAKPPGITDEGALALLTAVGYVA